MLLFLKQEMWYVTIFLLWFQSSKCKASTRKSVNRSILNSADSNVLPCTATFGVFPYFLMFSYIFKCLLKCLSQRMFSPNSCRNDDKCFSVYLHQIQVVLVATQLADRKD